MGTILLVKRASEAFSLVMKTNNCLRLRVLTRNMCLHLAYVFSPGVRVLTWRTCSHLVYVSSTGVCFPCIPTVDLLFSFTSKWFFCYLLTILLLHFSTEQTTNTSVVQINRLCHETFHLHFGHEISHAQDVISLVVGFS